MRRVLPLALLAALLAGPAGAGGFSFSTSFTPGDFRDLADSRLGGSAVALDVSEAQLVVSKGFPIVSPYAAAGFRRTVAMADFGDPVPLRHHVDAELWTGVVGARFTLLPLVHVVAEARRGSDTSFFVGAGVGL
jgi:hypothetical protein